MSFKHMDFKRKSLPLILTSVVALTVVAICAYIIIHNTPSPEPETPLLPAVELPQAKLTIIAEKEGPAGIEHDSGFIITGAESLSVTELTARLSLMPETTFTLSQRTETEFLLQPVEALRPASVYNVLLSENSYEPPMSWAFQTKDTFRLQKTYPANEGYWAPVDSGIEFTFTQPVADIEAYVSIFPALPGRFENFNQTTVVFIPSENMAYDTDYTVTLAADLPSLDKDTLGEEMSFTFQTRSDSDSNRSNFYAYDSLAETFTTTDPVFVKLYADEAYTEQEIQADIYRYPSLDAYLAAVENYKKDDFLPSEGLNKISGFSAPLIMSDEIYWRLAYLPLPENPGAGWYLVDMKVISEGPVKDRRAQKLLQITDISVYAQTANNQLLLWLNDAERGGALSGVRVAMDDQTVISDANGVALFDIPPPQTQANNNRYYGYNSRKKQVRIQQGDKQYGDYFYIYGDQYQDWESVYYTYVYTDRAAYQPNDTIRFWGLVLPRASAAARPERIKLEWTAGGLYPDGIDIEVGANGAFNGELKLEKQASGWEELYFTLEDKYLTRAGFSVMEYVKPVHTVALSADKEYYRKDDTIQVLAELSFFEGTPASGIEMEFSCWGYNTSYNSESQNNITDANGRCQALFSIQPAESWRPGYSYISVYSRGAEDQSVYFEQDILVFPSDYMAENSISAGEDGYTLNVEGYSIDFSAVDSGEFISRWDTKLLRGQTAELTGGATLHKVEYIRQKTGEFYDFINKVTVDKYQYERQDSIVDAFRIETENGRFVSQVLPYPEEEHAYYYIEIVLTTPDGQQLRETCYTPGERYYYWDSNRDLYQSYSFQQNYDEGRLNENGYIEEYYDGDYYYYGGWRAYRSLFEQANISLINQKEETPIAGRILYSVVGQKTYSYNISESLNFNLDFLPEYSPNVLVLGAYFDGRHIFTVEPTTMAYHFQDSELIIEVTPDKDRYRPGEEVTLDLRITDRLGQGQAAHYLVSVADEAAFAVMDQSVQPLSSIYSTFYINYDQYASYNQPYDFSSGAECGEGGGENTRRDFVDTLAFISGQADQNGRATIHFKLADNLTSWRLTSIAFREKSYNAVNMPLVGKDISNISCGLPFFINQVLNGRYLAEETIGLSLRGAGTAISSSDMVSYEVQLSGFGVETSQKAKALAGDFLPLIFDPLPAGEYTILIKATCGAYSDALELPLTVAESLLTTHRQQSGELNAGFTFQARRFPVRLSLYDIDNRLFYDTLYTLLSAGGQRADQILSRALAGQRLNELNDRDIYSTEPEISEEEASAWRYGLRLFPYAETDPLLTAKAAAVAGRYLDGPDLAEYFRKTLASEESYAEDICAAYMGLAALKEPVLLELRNFFKQAQDDDAFSLQDRLHLATGLALLGDHSTAESWYEANIHNALQSSGNTLYFSSANDDAHYNYTVSAEAAMLATLLNHADHRGLVTYLTSQRSTTYAPLLELAVYINKYSPKPESAAALSYTLGEQTVNINFADQRQIYLELGEEQLKNANFKVEQGNVGYSVYYFGGLEEAQTTLPAGVNINRTQSADTLKMGETLTVITTVTFDDTAAPGVYHIAQVAPTGLRFEDVPGRTSLYDSSGQRNWYYRVGEMGLIDFYIYPLSRQQNQDAFARYAMPRSVTFSYKARAVLPGTYIMEADAISYSGDNTLYASKRSQVTVIE